MTCTTKNHILNIALAMAISCPALAFAQDMATPVATPTPKVHEDHDKDMGEHGKGKFMRLCSHGKFRSGEMRAKNRQKQCDKATSNLSKFKVKQDEFLAKKVDSPYFEMIKARAAKRLAMKEARTKFQCDRAAIAMKALEDLKAACATPTPSATATPQPTA